MNFQKEWWKFISALLLSTLLFTLPGCGIKNTVIPQDSASDINDYNENDSEVLEEETGLSESDQIQFQEAKLPDDFPEDFPIPTEARVGSVVNLPGDQGYRIFFGLPQTSDEALAFFQSELPANGWTILDEASAGTGAAISFQNDEFEGEMVFVSADTGIGIDLSLKPAGSDEAAPDLPEGFGDSSALGESTGEFPQDLPIPASYTPVELTEKLKSEGYELAFSHSGMTEMAMLDFNIALMEAGWEIGDPSLQAAERVYIIPFSNPQNGFEGYALIAGSAEAVGMDSLQGSLIALHTGKP